MKKVIIAMLVMLVAVSIESQARLIISTKSIYSGGSGCSAGGGLCIIIGKATTQAQLGTMVGDLAYSATGGLTITMSKSLDVTPQDYLQYFHPQTSTFDPGGPATFDPAALASVGYTGPNAFAGPFRYTESEDRITVYITQPRP